MNGFLAILLKEFAHIRRDRTTILFTFVVPALQLTIFGYAINVIIENIPLAVYDLDGRQDSRRLVEALVETRTFKVADRVHDGESFRRALDSGRAKAGVLIPADYSERLLRGEQATVQVLVDGSDSQVATTAVNTVGLLVTQLSIGRAKVLGESIQMGPSRTATGEIAEPIEARTRLLYNPDLESAHFFVPGLIAIILQLVLLFLTSFSIVREREMGTLEQLFVTPVGRAGLMFGKLIPYALMAFGELLIVLVLMVAVFGVPIHGSLLLLIVLAALFIVTVLGLGLLISTLASTQLEAIQFAFLVMLPSVLLSGFMFPRSEMPWIIYLISCVLPVTYFVEILRGVILRGADLIDLAPHVIGLSICCVVILTLSVTRFRKQLD
ncbi:MAG TPA: ABC transporter permease [Phycisphaerae bacterium]|nr:ABC transporter permease [Phycisphaerae bacterium]